MHKRLRPRQHALSYRVFCLLVDVDRIGELASGLRLFSYNRLNVVSLYDRDYGQGDGESLSRYARRTFEAAGYRTDGRRVDLLTYPRVFGYAFNPLSVFLLTDDAAGLVAVNYEVSNTFGERKSYVVAAGAPAASGVHAQACRKELFVSPFANRSGRYGFRVRRPDEEMTVGVFYDDGSGPLLKTHFRGVRRRFCDSALLSLMIRVPLMTFKVMGAIHWEALKLWVKGVPLVAGHHSPRYSASYVAGGSSNGGKDHPRPGRPVSGAR